MTSGLGGAGGGSRSNVF